MSCMCAYCNQYPVTTVDRIMPKRTLNALLAIDDSRNHIQVCDWCKRRKCNFVMIPTAQTVHTVFKYFNPAELRDYAEFVHMYSKSLKKALGDNEYFMPVLDLPSSNWQRQVIKASTVDEFELLYSHDYFTVKNLQNVLEGRK